MAVRKSQFPASCLEEKYPSLKYKYTPIKFNVQYTGSSNIFSNNEELLFLNVEMDKKRHSGQTKPELKRVIEQNQLKILREGKLHVLEKKNKKNPA